VGGEMNIFQVLGQLDKLTESEPNEERVRLLQSFLAQESNVPYDQNAIILPEYCKELHEKSIDLLLRGYPGLGMHSSPSLVVKMLWQRFGCSFPFSIPDFLQPDDGTAPIFDIFRRFSEAILQPGETIEHADYGTFSFSGIAPESRKDAFLEGFSGSENGRMGAIIVTNKRLLAAGPRLVNEEGFIKFSRLLLFDDDSSYLASVDSFNHCQIDEVKFHTGIGLRSFRFVLRNVKFIETRTISHSTQTYLAPYGVLSTRYWTKLHGKTAIKEGDINCNLMLKEIRKQKKDVLMNRYRTLESKLLKFQ
jgi:hypothetical protein